MSIKLKVTADQVFAVAKLLENVYELFPATSSEQKVTRSIAFDLEEKFSSKRKQLIKQNSLFEIAKKHKIELKFHEAFALKDVINSLIELVNNVGSKNDLQIVHDFLHKETL